MSEAFLFLCSMDFPQYRKIAGFDRFYKITGERVFIEKYKLNGVWVENEVQAVQYPEILRIQDMLQQQWSFREMTTEEIELIFE